MTVQHVHVAEGGQAVIGNVNTPTRGSRRAKKMENNPMHWPMHRASRCRAKSKRSGLQCRAPAVRVCRMHGAAGGAPRGNRNALKHGEFTAETLALRKEVQALAWMARETLAAIE